MKLTAENERAITLWLSELLWENESNMQLFRIKGALSIANEAAKYSLQAVYDLFTVEASTVE